MSAVAPSPDGTAASHDNWPTIKAQLDEKFGGPIPSFADDTYGSCACGCGAEETVLLVCLNAPGEERLFVDLLHLHRWVVKRLEEEAE